MPSLTPNLGLALPLSGERGWGGRINANFSLLDGLGGALGQFAVRAANVNATTGAAVDRSYAIAAGTVIYNDGTLGAATARPSPNGQLLAAPSATTYVWMTTALDPAQGTALPTTGTYFPLAKITASTTAITAIVDLRGPVPFLRDRPTPYLPGDYASTNVAVASTTTVEFVDATTAPVTVTLPPSGSGMDGRVVTVVKRDASSNAVTVVGDPASTAGYGKTINGATTYALTTRYQRVTLMFSAATGVNEWAILGT